MKSFDLIVIGAGSGLTIAVEAANRGLKTAIIEEGSLGGTCLNRGCIPSKMVIHSADVAEEIRRANLFGLKASLTGIDFRKVTTRASHTVDEDSKSIELSLRQGKNPFLFKSRAKFIAPYTLQVGTEKIVGKKIVIAAGARPTIPPIPGLDKVPYLTSTEALRQTRLPKSMIIIGGGYIGAEMGHFYAALGCKVTVIQRGSLLVPREDNDVAELFTKLWRQRYGVVCDCDILRVEKKGKNIIVHTKHGGKEKKFVAEKLLIATGVKPNSDTLDLSKTGIKTNEKGFIAVNTYMETSFKNIWALGDIAGVYLFKHSANLEAEYVLQNLFGKKKAIDYYPMPHAIFTSPQIAGVGMTEQEAREKNKNYVVGKYEYQHTGMGAALEEKDGFVKFIVDRKSKEILGCHIIGPDASTLIHEVVVAMKAGRRRALDILRETVHVHPALSEVVQRAARKVPV
ncbi:MAG TPA: dihydrolipoyl dehydrogenase [Candidatus Nanoarchaeia archaeon]|nr:dihydrolipoyl dehydrogenase [Candidatus Nanoarchaeia archaeon]